MFQPINITMPRGQYDRSKRKGAKAQAQQPEQPTQDSVVDKLKKLKAKKEFEIEVINGMLKDLGV